MQAKKLEAKSRWADNFFVICEECKRKFKLDKDALGNISPIINGNQYFITYYDCPTCGRRHFVQIDDAKSKQMLVGVTITLAKLTAMKNKGKTISRKQSDRFKKARQDLSDYRMTLMKEFTGKLIHDSETGTDFELRFSV